MFFVGCGLTYLVGSYIHASFDPYVWPGEERRTMFVAAGIIGYALALKVFKAFKK